MALQGVIPFPMFGGSSGEGGIGNRKLLAETASYRERALAALELEAPMKYVSIVLASRIAPQPTDDITKVMSSQAQFRSRFNRMEAILAAKNNS